MSKTKLPILILILTIIYFFFLHPSSGMIGGFLYFIIGAFIPSIVNILLSYYIVFCLCKFNSSLLKGFIFLVISFLLGFNTFLAMIIFGYSPKDVTISIVRPLHENVSDSLYLHFTNENGYIIKADPLAYNSYGSNEGCMCSYFISPSALFSEEFWFNAFKPYDPVVDGFLPNVNIDKATYIIKQQYDLFPYYVLIKGEIVDQMDGKILFRVKYPRWLLLFAGSYPPLSSDSNFWSHAWNIFIHDNFWTWIIKRLFHPIVKPPFEHLPITNNINPIIEKPESVRLGDVYDAGGHCFNTATVPCTVEKNSEVKNCYLKFLENKTQKNACISNANKQFYDCISSKLCDKKYP